MEEPPAQESRPPANREVPRSRPPRATFSTPESTSPLPTADSTTGSAPDERSTGRAPRRQAAKRPAPTVTFQPPPDGDNPTNRGTAANAAKAAPAKAAPAKIAKGRKSAPTRAGAVPVQGVEPVVVEAAPAKRAPRKAAKAAAVPAQQSLPLPAQTVPDVTSVEVERAPVPVARYDWAAVLNDPGHLPEVLALAAVETIGPRAQQWANQVRESYPSATPQAVARLAVAQFARRGGVGGALAAVAGSYAPTALLGAAAWTHAELVLHVAAAHGQDPADQARAAELLVLTRVHATRDDADAALAAAKKPSTDVGQPLRRFGQALTAQTGKRLATQVGGWLAVRAVNRLFPGTGVLVAALGSRGAAETLGVRTIAFYQSK